MERIKDMMMHILQFLFLVLCQGLICDGKSWPPPPPWQEKANTARYLVHYADWGTVSAVSPQFGHAPMGTIQSYADGPLGNSSGVPYFYVASVSDTYNNIKYNNTVSLTITHAQSDYCQRKNLDPEEPICSRITLLGKILAVKDKVELAFAEKSLFARHPAMKNWPSGHDWAFYKLTPTFINLVDQFGPSTHLPIKDYFAGKP